MRGRKPKPTQFHIVEGTYRPDRHDGRLDGADPENDLRQLEDLPEAPPFLRGTARTEWNRIVPELARLNLLAKVDQAALAVYCRARADFSWAVYQIERHGRVVQSPSGMLRAHPALKIQKDAAETIRKFAVEFGLTPSARGRIRVDPGDDPDDPEDSDMFG